MEDWFGFLSRRKDGPWLAHRLDADTSGCLVIALRKAALLAAQAAFAGGTARKTYWAVVRGRPATERGTIDAPLIRKTSPQGWRMQPDARGQPALTEWRLRGTTGALSWLELHPRTGRTHQIRVHCLTLGCPILGDPVYEGGSGPLHLLARSIALPLDPAVLAEAPPPPHMQAALHGCGWEPARIPRSDRCNHSG